MMLAQAFCLFDIVIGFKNKMVWIQQKKRWCASKRPFGR